MDVFPSPSLRRRWPALVPLTVAVTAAHLSLAGAAVSAAPSPDRPAPPAAVAVRVLEPSVALAEPAAPLADPGPSASPTAAPAATPSTPPAPAPRATRATRPAAAVAAAAPAGGDVPVYRTRMPPPVTLRYVISRGPWSGNGELLWAPAGESYHARLEGRVAGFKVITWDSTGQFDAAGIAPTRFTDERRGKSALAANFQRSASKITYSGPADEYPLLPGSQDRLSWMVQIAAIAAADPQRITPGKRVSMFVTGARGDADVWTFQSIGTENVAIGGMSVSAVKLLREPRKPHDTRVEVWIAPSLNHAAVRVRVTQGNGDFVDQLLRAIEPVDDPK